MRLKAYLKDRVFQAMEHASAAQSAAFWGAWVVVFWGVVLYATAPK